MWILIIIDRLSGTSNTVERNLNCRIRGIKAQNIIRVEDFYLFYGDQEVFVDFVTVVAASMVSRLWII
jgi:hypothetical protein